MVDCPSFVYVGKRNNDWFPFSCRIAAGIGGLGVLDLPRHLSLDLGFVGIPIVLSGSGEGRGKHSEERACPFVWKSYQLYGRTLDPLAATPKGAFSGG